MLMEESGRMLGEGGGVRDRRGARRVEEVTG